MGNRIVSGRKKAKVMKIDGEFFRIKTPAKARDVTKEYSGYVLLDSEAVKNFGVRAKPLEPSEVLRPKKTYFLVELPKFQPEKAAAEEEEEERMKLPYRRVTSGLHIGAKERLELLMLSRRSISDVAIARSDGGDRAGTGPVRVKLRLPRAQVTKIVEGSNDDSEVAEKIIDLYMDNTGEIDSGGGRRKLEVGQPRGYSKPREKHVSFAVE